MARDVADTDDVCKPAVHNRRRRFDWFRMYPDRYLRATRHLSELARCAYSDILMLIYASDDGRIPDDNRWCACALHLRPHRWRKAKGELLAQGKIMRRDGYLYNKTANEILAEREMAAAETHAQKGGRLGPAGKRPGVCNTSATSLQLGLALPTLSSNINDSDSIESESDTVIVKTRPTVESPIPVGASSSSAAANVNLDILMQRLVEAAGESLAEPAAAPGLLSLSIPLWWQEQGCDLERDVLPALRKVAMRRRGPSFKKIVSWEYYNNLVAENRDARSRGLEAKHSPAEPKRNGLYYDPEVARRYRQDQEELLKRPLPALRVVA